MGDSHIGGMVGILGSGIDLDAVLDARVRMLRELERIASEATTNDDAVIAAIRELLLEAEAELDH
jgi:hypothetical protein